MNESAFAATARQGPVAVLRLQMRPYSIGHELLLLAQGNALLRAEESFNALAPIWQRVALKRAALVCYRSWRENQKREKHLWLWSWLNRNADWPLEIATFRNYRKEGAACPNVPDKESYVIANAVYGKSASDYECRRPGGSYYARLLAYLSRGGLYRELGHETPQDVPLAFANHLFLSELEADGSALVENDREAQVREEMEGHKQAVAAERNECPG